jgi:N-acyl-D-aspartate/D-glutamate deacylase
MTRLESFLFDSWGDKPESEYRKLQWVATGERLTRETFLKYRKQGGLVIIHANTEDNVRTAMKSPLTMVASDGFDVIHKATHPRSAGTYSRTVARYVREERAITLMEALRKMSLMPAQRLEARVPEMRDRGRIREGAIADIVVFDPQRLQDRATYEEPDLFSTGMQAVLVHGEFVVRDAKVVDGATPGRAIRARVGGR